MTHALPSPTPSAVPSTLRPRVLRLRDLMREDRGWTRGHASCSFDDLPPGAPGYLEYGALRLAVLQEIDPGGGYPMHPHAEIETVTVMLAGALTHEDSVGHRQIVTSSEVAVLSAGTGIEHAEMVHGEAKARAVMFWLRSSPSGLEPRFQARSLDRGDRRNRLVTLVAGGPFASASALHVRSPARVLGAVMDAGASAEAELSPGRRGYLVTTDGAVIVDGARAEPGERVLLAGGGRVRVEAVAATEVVLVDIPA